ncbi:glycosyltransferase [Kineobactrum sediminis]|uniref:Glycosyltransferase n=1 Tax=Kineobactrum sediminis TaxID=1905677 RepID=A0A2N5Y2P2_9GAMM|nr:TIGR04283 family arsenosugar biosynthesis glycosyltransferase [Kineobactrum sediminis]PLW82670.1 glycosyltransferase [Kineobactrum sediminis]
MASPSYSFVIPVLNESTHIERLLQLLARKFPDAERIVVDGNSNDDTVARALVGCTHLLIGERGRAAQMNLGASIASGDYLLFLHADSEPDFDAPALGAWLANGPAWGFFQLRLSGGRRIFRLLERAINLRSRLSGIGTGDQMLFVTRSIFATDHEFAPLPLMEDVELCRRLRRMSVPSVAPLIIITSSRRWEQRGVWRTILQMWSLRLAFALGVPAARLWQVYYGRQA